MRISTIRKDPGYVADAGDYTVTLDGNAVSGVITADTDYGFVRLGNDRVVRGSVTISKGRKSRRSGG